MPLEFNPTTNEPFIRIRKDIVITPHRPTDALYSIRTLNDPAVYKNLSGPPFPYGQSDWENWYAIASKAEKMALDEYMAAEKARTEDGVTKWCSLQPGSVIRSIDETTGEEEAIGNIAIRRRDFIVIEDEIERKRIKEINDSLEAGNHEIQWEMGFVLSPSAQGRGIMTAALTTLIKSFYIPDMNCHIITGTYFDYNLASKKVFENSGFEFVKDFPDCVELQESKWGVKGERIGVGMMKWERKD